MQLRGGRGWAAATVATLAFAALFAQPAAARDSHWFAQVIPAGRVDCFYEVLEAGIPVRVSTVVYSGGSLDIRVLVRHTMDMAQIAAVEPRNVHVKTFFDTKERQHLDFTTDMAGEYSFCFDNRPIPPATGLNVHAVPAQQLDTTKSISSADKYVAFELHFRDNGARVQKGDEIKKGDSDTALGADEKPAVGGDAAVIGAQLSRIRDVVDDVASESSYFHFREEANRNTAESSNARVMWLTILETACLLVVTTIEIYLIRSWFASHSPKAREWA